MQADLQPLDRRVDVAGGAARGGLLTEHVPRLDRPAQLESPPRRHRGAEPREAELEERVQPAGLEVDAVRPQVGGHLGDVGDDVVRQQESAVQVRAPCRISGARSGSSQNRATSARTSSACTIAIWECGGISKPRSSSRPSRPRARVRAVQLVDAELGAVGVAGDVGQQVPQRAVDHPRPDARRRPWSAARSRRTRSPVRTASPARPSSTRGACEVGPMNRPENRYDSDGWRCQ